MSARRLLWLMVPLLLAAKKPPPPPPEPAPTVTLGVEKWRVGDYATAVAIWTPFAQNGDAAALFNLGQAYKLGRGVPQDLTRARDYYAAAAAKGSLPGQATYGIMLFQAGNKAEALRWLKLAADRGEPRAQYVLGVATFNGDGTRRSRPLGYGYLLRAADGGLAQAKTMLTAIEPTLNPADRSGGMVVAASLAAGTGIPAAYASSGPQTIPNPFAARAPAPAGATPGAAPAPAAPATTSPASAPAVIRPQPAPASPPPAKLAPVAPPPAAKPAPAPVAQPPVATKTPPAVTVPPPAVISTPPTVVPAAPPAKPRALPAPVATVEIQPSTPAAAPTAPPAAKPDPVAPAKPTPKPTAPKPDAAKPDAAKPKPVPKGWRVQLGAFSTAAKAEAAWAATRKAVANPPGPGKPIYDAGEGIVKLQLGPFASKAEAQKACAQLSDAGRACFTVAP